MSSAISGLINTDPNQDRTGPNLGGSLYAVGDVTARENSISGEQRERLAGIVAEIQKEITALQQEGAQRIKNNEEADKAAEAEAKKKQAMEEAAKLRDALIKKEATLTAQAEAEQLAAMKHDNPEQYVAGLKARRTELEKELKSPQASAAYYTTGAGTEDEAKRAAAVYALQVQGKIAVVTAEISATEHATAKKRQAADKQALEDHVRLLQVKAQAGGLDDQKAALNSEIDALEKDTSLRVVEREAKVLEIKQRIAKLDAEAQTKAFADQAREVERSRNAQIELIRRSQFLTDQEKAEKLRVQFAAERAELEKEIAAATAAEAAATDPTTRNYYRGEKNRLQDRLTVGIPGDEAQLKPLAFGDQLQAQLVQMKNGFTTLAQAMTDTLGGATNGLSNGIQGLLNRTQSWKQAATSMYVGIGQAANKAVSDMAAQWLVKHTLMAAISRIFHTQDVTQHVVGEAAKTGATAAGATARGGITLGETIFHGVQVAIRTAAHVLGEIAKTAATAAGTAMRIPMVLAESVVNIVKAAAGAMSAVASIPYVGPILAIAALAAVMGAGMAAVNGARKGFAVGGYTDEGEPNKPVGVVHAGEWVAPQWMVKDTRFGPMIRDMEEIRNGRTPGYSAGGMTASNLYVASGQSQVAGGALSASAAGARSVATQTGGGAPVVNIAQFNTKQDAETWLRSQPGRRTLHDFVKGEQYDLA